MTTIGFEQPESITQVVTKAGLQGFPFNFSGHDAAAEPAGVVQVSVFKADVEIPHHAKGFPLLTLHFEVTT